MNLSQVSSRETKKHKEQNPNAALGGRTGADNGLMANVNKQMLDGAGNGQCQCREQSEEGKQIQQASKKKQV